MAKTKAEQAAQAEKTEQAVAAVTDAKPEDAKLQAALQAQVDKLTAELAAAQARIAELEALLAQVEPTEGEAETPAEPAYQVGGAVEGVDVELVAIKSKHGHAFWRSGYRVLPEFTFVRRADFEPEAWARLLSEPMAIVREAVLPEQA